MSLKPDAGILRHRTVHELLIFSLEMQHTDGVHAFKMAEKIARKEGHRQMFVEYVNEIADNSKEASFLFDEGFTKIALATIQSPESNKSVDQLALNHCLGSGLYEDVFILI